MLGLADSAVDERRLITALFADISGFTTLADSLDPEHLVEIVDPVLRRMVAVVERYEGRVVKYAGDAVLAFFGAPVAHEDDALRAVLCAHDMQREVAAVVAELPAEGRNLTLHIGVNTGHVVTGYRGGHLDYSVLGDAVNVAQRLEASAGAGEILVGERTRALVGDALGFESVGALTLKGKAEPVPAWRVAETPVPAGPAGRALHTLVGRQEEREALLGMLQAVLGGRPRTMAVVGEPGVGKTRLVESAAEMAGELGMLWLGTRCVSYGGALPYWPYAELLRNLAGIRPDTNAVDAVAALRELSKRVNAPEVLPYLCELLGGGDWTASEDERVPEAIRRSPSAMRHRIQDAVVTVVTGMAAGDPAVLALEDVHWIDEASLELTQMLVRRREHLPLGLVVTARPEAEEFAVGFDLSTPDVVRIDRLHRADIAELATRLLDGPVCHDLVDALESRTQGNPLFIREILHALSDAGGLERTTDGWRLVGHRTAGIPTTIEAVLSARIDRLPRELADVLQAAALIGREVNVDLLRATLGCDGDALERSCKVLVEHDFLVEAERPGMHGLQFTHALVVDVAYGRLAHRRRREMHRRVVAAAATLYGDGDEFIDLLAHHAHRGVMGIEGRAYVLRAARRAASMFANAEAIEHLKHALEMTGDDPDSAAEAAAVRVELGRLLEHVGAYDEAVNAYAPATEADTDARIGLARVLITQGRYDDARSALDDAEAHLGKATPAARGMIGIERGRLLALTGRLVEACATLEAAIDLLQGVDAVVRAEAQVTLAAYLEPLKRADDGLHHVEQAVVVLEERGDLSRLTAALRVAGALRGVLHRPGGGIDMLRRALEVARQIGHAEEEGASLINLGCAYQQVDQLEQATACFRDALAAFERIGLQRGVAAAYCNLADVLQDLQRWDESAAAAAAGLAAAEDINYPYWITGGLLGLSSAYLWQERWEEARASAQRALTLSDQTGLVQRSTSARMRLYAAQHRMRVAPTADESAAVECLDLDSSGPA